MITMENKQRVKTIAVIFIIAIVLISLTTEFLYIFNNKYTYSKLQPEKGVLTLSQEEIDSNSFHFLIKDWEFYEDALLTPSYFNNHTSKPPRNKEFPIHNLKNLIWLIFASKTFTFASNILPMENKKYSNLKILFQI